MPSTTELTETHRLAQRTVAARTVDEILASFGLLDPKALNLTSPEWLRVATSITARYGGLSARVAGTYLTELRTLLLGESFPVTLSSPPVEQISTSLLTTGPVGLKRSTRVAGVLDDRMVEIAKVRVSGAASRLALAGGRQTIVETIAADPAATGWRRIISPSGCDFCQMLANRGAVYAAETATFAAHDHCRCSAEPAYGTAQQQVTEYQPSARQLSPTQQAAANERARQWIDRNL